MKCVSKRYDTVSRPPLSRKGKHDNFNGARFKLLWTMGGCNNIKSSFQFLLAHLSTLVQAVLDLQASIASMDDFLELNIPPDVRFDKDPDGGFSPPVNEENLHRPTAWCVVA